MARPLITLSIVSHEQARLAEQLLSDIAAIDGPDIEVIFTENVPEQLTFVPSDFRFPLRIIKNDVPKGFGANHNAAFEYCGAPYFCVLNPDIRFAEDPFSPLVSECEKPAVGAAAPLIVNDAGECEDSARRFPTVPSLARKCFAREKHLDYGVARDTISPDWVAGMFVLLPSSAYSAVHGFDERYYLYYEDVDLCRRLRALGLDVRLVPAAHATHLARRESHRNIKFLRWHLESMARYMWSRSIT